MKTGRYHITLTRSALEALVAASAALQVELLRRANGADPADALVARAEAAQLNVATRTLADAREEERSFGTSGPTQVNDRWIVAWHGDWTGEDFGTHAEAASVYATLTQRRPGASHG